MSILINGMEMPKDKSLWLCIHPDGTVYNIKPDHGGGRQGNAVFLPPHGRCIDADALIRDASGEATLWCGYEYQDHSVVFEEDIKNAPTIVPAEGGTDECSEN